jgi:hypothetical protein
VSLRANTQGSAQRTAVQLRPQQETMTAQVATSEPVVHHHGRQAGRRSRRRGAAGSCNGLLGSPFAEARTRSEGVVGEAVT